jgi:hypothetical protein
LVSAVWVVTTGVPSSRDRPTEALTYTLRVYSQKILGRITQGLFQEELQAN